MMSTEALEVIYLAGHHACGKTEFSRHLSPQIGAPIIETGAMVRACYAQRGGEFRDLDIAGYVSQMEDQDPLFFTLILKNRIIEETANLLKPSRALVIGMRSLKNILELKEIVPGWEHTIIWIDVGSYDLLRRRYNQRENKTLNPAEFNNLIKIDQSLGIEELRSAANHTVVNDEGTTIDQLLHQGLVALGL